MNSLLSAIDRFCARHPNFGVKRLMLYIVIGNAAVLLFTMMDTTGTFRYWLIFSPADILRGQVWRLFTFAIIPVSTGLWGIVFLYFYYFIGNVLEQRWGSARFNLFFFSGMALTVIFGFLVYFIFHRSYGVTAYYLYMSMFFSFAALFPEQRVLLFFVIPLKIKWLAWLDGALFVYDAIQAFAMGDIAGGLLPFVAMLNFLVFGWDMLFRGRMPVRARVSQQKRTIEFRQAVNKANAERRAAPYRFRCAVCGRTDVTNPELEFRYCSRCTGYHCFCQEHIGSHVHFTE